LSHGVSLWQVPGVIIFVLHHTSSLATNQDIPEHTEEGGVEEAHQKAALSVLHQIEK